MSEVMTQNEMVGNLIEKAKKVLSATEFGNEIIRLREQAGLTQKRLASILKVDPAVISRIENGVHGVSLDIVVMLAIALNDNPHRLADIYWGIQSSEFDLKNKILLDSMWLMMVEHYQPPGLEKPLTPPIQFRADASYQAAADQAARDMEDRAKKKKVDPKKEEDEEGVEEPKNP
jgi:transcriptional regulator with XRE-family HTH domain